MKPVRLPVPTQPGWRNGRRGGFKIRCPKGRVGSSPTPGTWFTASKLSMMARPSAARPVVVRSASAVGRGSIERRLIEGAADIRSAREELRILDEQLAHFVDTADDARLRALVSDNARASREHRDAARTVSALDKDRTKWIERVAKLERRQDELLDQMLGSE